MRKATFLVAMLALAGLLACRRPVAESTECVFHAPDTLARIEGRMIDPTPLFWRGADRDALLLQDGTAQTGRAHAWRVDLRSGAVTEDAIEIVRDPQRGPVPAPNYLRFRTEREDYASLPLLRTDLKGSRPAHLSDLESSTDLITLLRQRWQAASAGDSRSD